MAAPESKHPTGTQIRLMEPERISGDFVGEVRVVPIQEIASCPNEIDSVGSLPDKLGMRIVGKPRVIPNPRRSTFFTQTARIWGRAWRKLDLLSDGAAKGDRVLSLEQSRLMGIVDELLINMKIKTVPRLVIILMGSDHRVTLHFYDYVSGILCQRQGLEGRQFSLFWHVSHRVLIVFNCSAS